MYLDPKSTHCHIHRRSFSLYIMCLLCCCVFVILCCVCYIVVYLLYILVCLLYCGVLVILWCVCYIVVWYVCYIVIHVRYIVLLSTVLDSDISSPVTGPAEPVYVEEKMYPFAVTIGQSLKRNNTLRHERLQGKN